MCVVYWYNPSRCRGWCRRCRHRRHCCCLGRLVYYTHRERCTCVLYVTLPRTLSENIGCGMLCVVERADEETERTNERMHTSMRNTKNTHRMPISFRFLLFYFNISFLFHSFVCIAPDQTTQTKSTERVCARYMLRVFYAQAAIFTPFLSQVAYSHMTVSSSSSMEIEQMSDGLATAVCESITTCVYTHLCVAVRFVLVNKLLHDLVCTAHTMLYNMDKTLLPCVECNDSNRIEMEWVHTAQHHTKNKRT